MRLQVLDLSEHVELGHASQLLFLGHIAKLSQHSRHALEGVAHPFLHARHAFHLLGMQQRFHHAAVGVSAHHDHRHLQRQHRVFDAGGDAADKLHVGRNHVAGIALDEDFARIGLRHQVGIHPRVGAGHEQRQRLLAALQALEHFALRRKNLRLKFGHALRDPGQRILLLHSRTP